MKKKFLIVILSMMSTIGIPNIVCASENAKLNNPTQDYIFSCLTTVSNVTEVAAVSEENDPNGKLNKENGYYSAVYFSIDLVDQEGVHGEDLIDKGTDAGGCIEAYNTAEDAEQRDSYLAKFDDSWLFNAGYHTTIGTLVIRTSQEISEEEQKEIENKIINALTLGEYDGMLDTAQDKIEGVAEKEQEIIETTKEDNNGVIIMPHSASDYIGSEWTIDSLIAHFTELGFKNICAEPCEPSNDDFDINIFELVIEKGWFSTDPWNAGEEFKSDAEITIYYNEYPVLNIDNCPELSTVLTSKINSYMSFCEKYDGRYVEFDGYVINHLTYDGGTSHIIEVTGGNYDGNIEIDGFNPHTYQGMNIRIGDRTWGNEINKSVDVGDHVTVVGKIDASWAEYYECVYIETMELSRREDDEVENVIIENIETESLDENNVLYQVGAQGDEVRKIQEKLIILGYLSGTADGDYGNLTKSAVEMFQQEYGLDITGTITAKELEILYQL